MNKKAFAVQSGDQTIYVRARNERSALKFAAAKLAVRELALDEVIALSAQGAEFNDASEPAHNPDTPAG